MAIQQPSIFFQTRQRLIYMVTMCLATMVIINVSLDYFLTLSQNSSFYISESLLFSTYWILYIPLLLLISKLSIKTEKFKLKLALTLTGIIIHLVTYPALVWFLSKLFYYHTFSYWQTFNFGLSAYFIKTGIIYGFSLIIFILFTQKIQSAPKSEEAEEKNEKQNFINRFLISDSNNKKLVLQLSDILYFSANSPYINIYHLSKKFLYTETLKSLETQLNNNQFVRIHKSYIVNIDKILSVQSRQNGDYDITLSNETSLRVSRTYAKNFKLRLSEKHQLTVK